MKLKWYWVLAAVVVAGLAAGGAYMFWKEQESRALPAGIVGINGRVEATQAQIATKIAGRVIEIVPREGDIVAAGSIFARLDKSELEAQLHQGQAEAARYRRSLARAQADIQARKAELKYAEQQFKRSSQLVEGGWMTRAQHDQRKQALDSAAAALTAATEAVEEAQAAVKAADANVKRLQSLLDDTTIKSPLRGRVQYRLIEPGEVLPAGGRIATVMDLTDVYMTIFLPASQAGRLTINDEARVVVDAVPEYVFPATVSFVSPESQFTPKSVETQSEREQLYFRVKLQAPLSLLQGMEERVKTGLRGMGYVRVDPAVAWPTWLAPKLPPASPQASR
jgi:HlyD family secretion protein